VGGGILFSFSWLRPPRVVILDFFPALSIELRTVWCESFKKNGRLRLARIPTG
jgi:hypothetical protein